MCKTVFYLEGKGDFVKQEGYQVCGHHLLLLKLILLFTRLPAIKPI